MLGWESLILKSGFTILTGYLDPEESKSSSSGWDGFSSSLVKY